MLFLILVIAVIVIAFSVVGGGRRARQMRQMTWDAMAPEQQARVTEAQRARSRNNAGLFLFLVAIVGVMLLIAQIAQMLGDPDRPNKQRETNGGWTPATTPATAPATPNTQSAVTTQAPAESRFPTGLGIHQWTAETCARLSPDAVYRAADHECIVPPEKTETTQSPKGTGGQ
jgi:hypothetical protein